ncbi:alpha-ketoglutarate-dependent dioxygenase [Herbaspirillum hiltneri N3]|uniref:Alpha-ketoglutarate-dependent dioxygenase n=1 Tax=Herbaspirillum hiltneri N3 TaxID=1262470 RepID=A0ABM5V2K6_9BURK|nr:DNA oxidative demethylase AlkB [Herbaspirillum hiltneri]AKZ63669.1 alpha-ketoglutarate-dependent dioxygenase [Herbaspirillum hiltneri N3]
MTGDLFAALRAPTIEHIADGATWLRAYAEDDAAALIEAIAQVTAQAPFRQMQTPGGYTMSVAMSNCGELGWVTDRRGYRYQREDPLSQQPWPEMPAIFLALAERAAAAAGFHNFLPDACLINRYTPGARMSLHQDKNERDMSQPIVSVSLGLPATFLFGGAGRADKPLRMRLESGDVVVWGGPARLRFHGVDTLAQGAHALTGDCRYNITFRKAG